MTDRYQWTQDDEGAWHARGKRLWLTVVPCQDGLCSWVAWLLLPGDRHLEIARSGPRIADLVPLDAAKRQAVAAASAFSAAIADDARRFGPRAFDDLLGPPRTFVSRCQVCMEKHRPHCEGGAQ